MVVASRWKGNRVVVEGTPRPICNCKIKQLISKKNIPIEPCDAWAMPCKDFPEHATTGPAVTSLEQTPR